MPRLMFANDFDDFADAQLRVTVEEIQTIVAQYYGLDRATLLASGVRPIARKRQIAMYLARGFTPHSFPLIARLFGKSDHTTVGYAVSLIDDLAARDSSYENDIRALIAQITSVARALVYA